MKKVDDKKFVRAHYPWNEELAKETKVDTAHHEPVKDKPVHTAEFEYSIEIACSLDELNSYQVGVFSLGKTKNEVNISSWNKTQIDKNLTLLTASVKVNELKTLSREFFISSGHALLFNDVKPVNKGVGIATESFIPIKPAVQIGDRLGWPTEGYFYHFINDLLIHEYKLIGDAKWAFQITQSTKDHLTDELISNHQYSFILLPWKINKTVVVRQHLLYLPLKMSTKQLEELTPNWLNENGCLLNIDEIVQTKDEKKVTSETETSSPKKIQDVGHAVSFFNAYSTGGKRELKHNIIAIFNDNAIPQKAKILNLCKIKDDGRVPVNDMKPPPPPPPPLMNDDSSRQKPKWAIKEESFKIQSLRYYSAQGYILINQYLRGNYSLRQQGIDTLLSRNYLLTNEPSDEEFKNSMSAYINDIVEGLNSLPETDHKFVYRGLKLDNPALSNLLKEYTTVGNIIIDNAFMSTSPDEAWVNDTIFRMSLEKGHKGRILGDIAHFKGESEMLFPPNTKLKIVSVLNSGFSNFEKQLSELRLSSNGTTDKSKIKRIINMKILNS